MKSQNTSYWLHVSFLKMFCVTSIFSTFFISIYSDFPYYGEMNTRLSATGVQPVAVLKDRIIKEEVLLG